MCGRMFSAAHLKEGIQERMQAYDDLNIDILENLLKLLPLNPHFTKAEVVDTFRQFQDFINAKYQIAHMSTTEFEIREDRCHKALEILLYGVIDRKETSHD